MQLFSKPQHTAASRTNSEPAENFRLLISSKESSAQDSTTKKIPAHRRGEIFSLKIISAMIAVATISKLLSKEAFAAVVLSSPISRKMGAAMSSTIMAMVCGSSAFVMLSSVACIFFPLRIRAITPMPSPAPTYKNPAIRVEGI